MYSDTLTADVPILQGSREWGASATICYMCPGVGECLLPGRFQSKLADEAEEGEHDDS